MFTTQPSTTAATSAITPAVVVSVEDALGNVETTGNAGATDSITVAIGTNPGSATLSGTTTVTAAGGQASFSTLSINKTGNGYTLTAADGTAPDSAFTATSAALNITPVVHTYPGCSYVSTLTSSGASAIYQLNEASGATAADVSGHSNTATITSVGSYANTPGPLGCNIQNGALGFNGTATKVVAPTTLNSATTGSSLTVMGWFKATNVSSAPTPESCPTPTPTRRTPASS